MTSLPGPANILDQDHALEANQVGHSSPSNQTLTHQFDQSSTKTVLTRNLGQSPSCLPSPTQSISSSADGDQLGDFTSLPSDNETEILFLAVSLPETPQSISLVQQLRQRQQLQQQQEQQQQQQSSPLSGIETTNTIISQLPHEPYPILDTNNANEKEECEEIEELLTIDNLQGPVRKLNTEPQEHEQQELIPSPQSKVAASRIPNERKHWSLDQLQIEGLRNPVVFSSQSLSEIALEELHGNGSGDGLGSTSRTYFRHSGGIPSDKALVTQRQQTEFKGRDSNHSCTRSNHHSLQQDCDTTSECYSTMQSPCPPQSETAHIREPSGWVLPPIPTFEELSLRFDRSRTSSMNALEKDASKMHLQKQQPQQQLQQHINNQMNAQLAITNSQSKNNNLSMEESRCLWDSENIQEESALVMPDIVPDRSTSIFDDILSDNNEDYIIWSVSSGKDKTSLSTSMSRPTLGLSALGSGLSESVNYSVESDTTPSTSYHQYRLPSNLDKRNNSAGQDRSLAKRWSTIEPLTVHNKEVNQSTDTLQSFNQSKQPRLESNSSGSNLRSPKAPSTPNIPAEPPQNNRVIMAATIEKLVEKLTSEIDYTFLTDFFLIYRLFISPMALLKLIIVRFHWALIDDSPSRQIVRIRTFVTLRHWLLNYFEFDFMRSKDLRKTLGNHLNVLAKHTRVIKSMREQRIIKELRRYVQSLKTLHYRKQAQQKLEKQCRKEAERRHRLQARRSSVGRHGSSLSRPLSSNILFNNQGISSSNRSSFVHGPINRQSNESEVLTEILTVEFRSSDQSDEDDDVDSDSDDDDRDEDDLYNDEDDLYYDEEDDFCSRSGESSENNGFEPSSDNSIDDSEYDSVYSDSAHEDSCSKDNIPGQWRQRQPDIKCVKRDKEAFHSTIITHEDLAPECHLPSPAFSPQSGNPNQEGFGSLNSRLSPSADSSTAPRARTRRSRPGIPDFQAEYSNNTKTNPTPHGAGTGSRRSSRAKVQSRPLSTFQPLLSPPLSVPPLSPRGSLRSVEPYMNPPPRSVNSIEKKKPWSRYMSATVGHLSKMKRVFKSNSNRNTDRTVGDGVVRSNVSTSGRPRSERYWQGNLSDPEGEKVPYLLACPGMSIILSDERYGVFGKGNSRVKRGGASREDRRSGWSSDGDYSQYELTQHQRNQEMLSSEERELETRSNRESRIRSRRVQNFHEPKSQHKKVSTLANDRAHFDTEVHEIESFDHDSEFRKSIYSECERGQYFSIPTTLPRHGSEAVSAFDERAKISPLTDIEIAELCHCQGECECMATSKNANADDIITVPSTTNSARVPNLRRTTRRRSRDQRASWMTLSSTTSSMFGPLLNSNHLSPGQAIRQRGAFANVDRFVERFYNPQMDALTTKEAGLSQTGSDPQSMKELSLSRLEEPLSTQTEISKEQNASFSISNRPTSAMPNQTASDNIRRIYNIESTSIHPLAIIELQSIDPIPSGASTRALEPFVVNQEDSSRSLIQTQPSFIPLKDTKLRTKTTRSNSQPNLLTSLSNTENVAGKLQGGTTLPWQQHVNEQNLRVLDHCRHSRSSQAPSRPSSLRFKYPFMRRGSVDPPSIASHQDSKSSFSAQQQHGKLKIQVDPHVRSLSSSLSTTPSHFVSIVMRYSSELIAQQLCLIEREMLSQVQWYELVNAGWTKKAPATGQNQDENLPASTMSSNKESSRSSRSSREPSIQINEANLETIEDRKPNNVQATSGSIDDNQGGPSGICATNEHNSLHGVNQSEGTATPTLGISGSAGLKMESSNEQKPKAEDSVGTKRLIERFNLTCQWVTSEIVRTRDLHQRVKVVEKFIRIAHTCYNHSNFSSLIQLMLGLQSHNVSRLNQTWALVRAQEMRIMEDLVEYTSPFHNWKHLRDDMKSIADEWGGSTNSNGGRRGKTATTMPEKAPSGSGGTTSLFFGKRHAKSIALGKLPKEDTSATGVGHNKPVTSPSARASKASSIAHTKDKETPIEKFAQQEKEGAKVDQPKGCIPFLGLYLSDLVFNAELPSYIERPSKSKKYANEQSSSTKHKCMQLDARAQPGPPLSSGSATLSKAETTSATKHALSTASSSLQQTESSWPLINIHKHRTTATIIKRILTFKTLASRYPFEQDPDVYPLLMAIQGLDPAEISRLSSIYEEKEKESDIRRS